MSTGVDRMNTFAHMPERLERLRLFTLQVFVGNPIDMFIQFVAGILGVLVGALVSANPFIGFYAVIVTMDTILGIRLSAKEGRRFMWSRLLWGPGEKIVFAAVILYASVWMDMYVPGEMIAHGMAAFLSAAIFLESIGKYDKISGTNILKYARKKLGGTLQEEDDTI